MMKTELFFYKNLLTSLMECGSLINTRYWCVYDKTTNEKKYNMLWRLYDTKVSHVDLVAMDSVLGLFT